MATDDSHYLALTEVFRGVFGREGLQLRPDLTPDDVEGWDSFKQIELIVAIEQRFGIQLTSEEMDGLACVGDLANLIARKLRA